MAEIINIEDRKNKPARGNNAFNVLSVNKNIDKDLQKLREDNKEEAKKGRSRLGELDPDRKINTRFKEIDSFIKSRIDRCEQEIPNLVGDKLSAELNAKMRGYVEDLCAVLAFVEINTEEKRKQYRIHGMEDDITGEIKRKVLPRKGQITYGKKNPYELLGASQDELNKIEFDGAKNREIRAIYMESERKRDTYTVDDLLDAAWAYTCIKDEKSREKWEDEWKRQDYISGEMQEIKDPYSILGMDKENVLKREDTNTYIENQYEILSENMGMSIAKSLTRKIGRAWAYDRIKDEPSRKAYELDVKRKMFEKMYNCKKQPFSESIQVGSRNVTDARYTKMEGAQSYGLNKEMGEEVTLRKVGKIEYIEGMKVVGFKEAYEITTRDKDGNVIPIVNNNRQVEPIVYINLPIMRMTDGTSPVLAQFVSDYVLDKMAVAQCKRTNGGDMGRIEGNEKDGYRICFSEQEVKAARILQTREQKIRNEEITKLESKPTMGER